MSAPDLSKVKVGDVLAHYYGGWQHPAPTRRTVAKVGKIHVTDSAGDKWRMNGRKAGGSYGSGSVRPWCNEDDDALRDESARSDARLLSDLLTKAANRDTDACVKNAQAIRALIKALKSEVKP